MNFSSWRERSCEVAFRMPSLSRGIPVTIVGMTSTNGHFSSHRFPSSTCLMADTGANVCITNDPSILTSVVDIPPITLGVAVTLPDTSSKIYVPNRVTYRSHLRTAHYIISRSSSTHMPRKLFFHPPTSCGHATVSTLGARLGQSLILHQTLLRLRTQTTLPYLFSHCPHTTAYSTALTLSFHRQLTPQTYPRSTVHRQLPSLTRASVYAASLNPSSGPPASVTAMNGN